MAIGNVPASVIDLPLPEPIKSRFVAAMQEARRAQRHHYVPRGYLKAWTLDGTVDGVVYAWDTMEGRNFSANTKNVCVSADYFTVLDSEERETRLVEGILSVLDHEYARLLDQIRASDQLPKDPDDRSLLAFLIAMQATRVPQRRRVIDDAADYMMKLVSESKLRVWGLDPDEFRIQANNSMHVRTMVDVAWHAGLDWVGRDWSLYIASKPWFATCDSPVLYDDLSSETGIGMVTAEQIILPISPAQVLMMEPRHTAQTTIRQAEAATRRHVERLLIRSRERWIFGRPDQEFLRNREGQRIPRRRQLLVECVAIKTLDDSRSSCTLRQSSTYGRQPVIRSCGRHR